MQYRTPYANFEWAESKAASNLQKHGISFERATEAFADVHALIAYDSAHSTHEERFTLLGMVNGMLLVLVVFTEQTAIRIISARKATRQEEKLYAAQ